MKNLPRLTVPNPCDENWKNFSATAIGGYCSSCKKTVIDFTKMSDETIIQFLEDHPGHTCGRFRSNQLAINTGLARLNPGTLLLLKVGLLSLLLALISRPASAQQSVNSPAKEITQNNGQNAVATQTIKGIVKDENGDALPGASVYLKGASIGTSANEDGSFEFPKRLKEGDILIFSFIGYEEKQYVVPAANGNEEVYLRMALDVALTLGEVSIEQLYSSKNSHHNFWTRVRKIF